MTAVIKTIDNKYFIEWTDGIENGLLTISYNEKGGYTIDAEYIGFEKIIRIIKALNQ